MKWIESKTRLDYDWVSLQNFCALVLSRIFKEILYTIFPFHFSFFTIRVALYNLTLSVLREVKPIGKGLENRSSSLMTSWWCNSRLRSVFGPTQKQQWGTLWVPLSIKIGQILSSRNVEQFQNNTNRESDYFFAFFHFIQHLNSLTVCTVQKCILFTICWKILLCT